MSGFLHSRDCDGVHAAEICGILRDNLPFVTQEVDDDP